MKKVDVEMQDVELFGQIAHAVKHERANMELDPECWSKGVKPKACSSLTCHS